MHEILSRCSTKVRYEMKLRYEYMVSLESHDTRSQVRGNASTRYAKGDH